MPERRFNTSFWTHPKIRALPTDGMFVAHYLETHPYSNIICTGRYQEQAFAADLKMGEKRFRSAVDSCIEIGHLAIDWDHLEYWIISGAKRQCRSPALWVRASRLLKELHSTAIISAFLRKYGELMGSPQGVPKESPGSPQGVLKDLGTPYSVLSTRERGGVGGREKNGKPADSVTKVVGYLNEQCNRRFSAKGGTAEVITARLNEGYTERQLRAVAWHYASKWGEDPKMAEYLRPSTLYAPKRFQERLDEAAEAILKAQGLDVLATEKKPDTAQ